jgi:hypothetical protein
MKNKFILKLFISFLKKNDVYYNFLYNLETDVLYRSKLIRFSKIDLTNPVDYVVHTIKCNPAMIFNNAFNWFYTDGIDREKWCQLHCKWGKTLKRYDI